MYIPALDIFDHGAKKRGINQGPIFLSVYGGLALTPDHVSL